MWLASSDSPSIRPLLVLLGAVVAPVLAALGIFGLGDAELAARAQLEREARARVGGVQSQWSERLARDAPIAETVGDVVTLANGTRLFVADPIEASTPDERAAASRARLTLLGARAAFGSGQARSALELCERAIGTSPSLAGEAVLLWVQMARLSGEFGAAFKEDLHGVLASVGHGAAVSGTSGRLLALLAAAPMLESDELHAEARTLANQLQEGQVVLPQPKDDRMDLAGDGWRFHSDPWWAALQGACEERLGHRGLDWNETFLRRARRSRAAAAFVEAEFPGAVSMLESGRWAVFGDGDLQVALRATAGGEIRAALHRTASLDRSLQAMLPEGDDFLVSAFQWDGDDEGLAPPAPLAGTPVPLHIAASPSSRTLRSLTFRVRALRVGLVAVAVLLVLGSFAAWRTLSREARLRELRSTFVASVSHDLRTPVASISLLASNMASGYAPGSEAKYLASLQGEAARLRRLVDDLLDFGRLERGLPPRIRREPVQVPPWLEAFAEHERARCHAHGCALDLVTESLPAEASLDAPALERGLSNLIDNAIKHGRAEGVQLRVRAQGTTLVFEVEDSGSGLSAAALRADLFQPFERASAKTAGTGLGLSIVRAIAEGHGGSASLRACGTGHGAIATLEVSTVEGQAA